MRSRLCGKRVVTCVSVCVWVGERKSARACERERARESERERESARTRARARARERERARERASERASERESARERAREREKSAGNMLCHFFVNLLHWHRQPGPDTPPWHCTLIFVFLTYNNNDLNVKGGGGRHKKNLRVRSCWACTCLLSPVSNRLYV